MPQLGSTVSVATFAILLIALATKHLVADFLLQTSWIARGKERPVGWAWPLAIHVACHAGLTLVIVLTVAPHLWWLSLVEFVIHATIDRSKSVLARRGGWTTMQAPFWWLLGFDQFLHHMTDLGLAVALMTL